MAYDTRDFEKEVLLRSRQIPVLDEFAGALPEAEIRRWHPVVEKDNRALTSALHS
ncbi:MAG TPA: hypothetical protein PKM43_09055 [Verrucomicrobiota bacterium]|nr:hypothetical protein [Verrucomicrobiota bacterium]HRZ37541.1 hypothetical protein [Candidatus Paceibacterota bacterium]HRZ58611.1 hypothetical protein [Candidatus Paceibacterota bacterium]